MDKKKKNVVKKSTTKRRWFFDKRKLPQLERVRRMISSIATPWLFKLPTPKPEATLTLENFRYFTLRSFDEGLRDVIILNPLDFRRIIKWINKKRISFEEYHGQKIVFYSHPLTSAYYDNETNFYICLIQNEFGNWTYAVRNEEFFRAQGYRMACISTAYKWR